MLPVLVIIWTVDILTYVAKIVDIWTVNILTVDILTWIPFEHTILRNGIFRFSIQFQSIIPMNRFSFCRLNETVTTMYM